MRDEQRTIPPSADEAAAVSAFERAIKAVGEWQARLANIGRLWRAVVS